MTIIEEKNRKNTYLERPAQNRKDKQLENTIAHVLLLHLYSTQTCGSIQETSRCRSRDTKWYL